MFGRSRRYRRLCVDDHRNMGVCYVSNLVFGVMEDFKVAVTYVIRFWKPLFGRDHKRIDDPDKGYRIQLWPMIIRKIVFSQLDYVRNWTVVWIF